MSRLSPLDRALVLILVPLWAVCFTFGVKSQVRLAWLAAVAVSDPVPDSHPLLTGSYMGFVHPTDPLAESGLRAGDRMIRLGDADLLGVGTRGFIAHSIEQAGPDHRIPVVFERDGARLETSLVLAPASVFRPVVFLSFAFAVSALFLLLRARPTPTVRTYFYFAMCQAIVTSTPLGSPLEFHTWFALFAAGNAVYHPLMIRLAFLFPDDRAPESRWHRIWPWLFGAAFCSFTFLLFSSRVGIGESGFAATAALATLAVLAVATHKYRNADTVARRQQRWILFGTYCAVLPNITAAALITLQPGLGWLWFPSLTAAALFPLFLVISVLRFNLFDVDRLLSATASYNVLAVVLGAGALIVVPRIAEGAAGLVGVDPGTGQVVLSLALAAVLVPAHRRLRPQIDRLFFKERFALDRGVAELLPALSACTNARELTERTGEGLSLLLRPEGCVVYARLEESYSPVFAEGRAVPPAFEADSPLIGTLQGRPVPLSLSDAGRRPDDAPLGPFDRAALETLQAEVVVPVRGVGTLAAFLCLGPKRSGDVYTSTDLSLLAAVAETVSQQLQRFDQEEVAREARAMQESLRRYVPGAVADELESGAPMASGEREVSVLFVDIRGYTSFAESRRAEEIFGAVNLYTETVSQVVQKHGGSVVEFNGDGMMAVFGAPRELAHKERAAVEAGREIVAAVGALRVAGAQGETTKLSVGVGVATGEAYVGNIQAVDRMIWSAIGNTTNLAARLQSLTRELDAAVVIDATTRERAPSAAADFEEQPEVAIRGRRETQNVYALRLREGP